MTTYATHRTIGLGLAACLLILTWTTPALAQDNPNIVQDDTGAYYYVVQPGDTLWDISEKFLNSPYYWPDLWKVNSESVPITNPHLIYPGQRLRLFLRGEAPPPAAPAPAIAAPAPPPAPAPAAPPPARPREVQYYRYTPIDQVGFIRQEPVLPNGSIKKVRGNKKMISTGDIVYIDESDQNPLETGDTYIVYRISDPIFDSETEVLIGTQHFFVGLVEISKIEGGLAIGEILTAYRSIQVGDLLMPYEQRAQNIPLAGAPEGVNGKIILNENRTAMFGEHDTAFIDKGRRDGIEIGQKFSIFDQEAADVNLVDKSISILTPFDIGKFIVLHTEENNATVLITNSERAIQAGDRFHAPIE